MFVHKTTAYHLSINAITKFINELLITPLKPFLQYFISILYDKEKLHTYPVISVCVVLWCVESTAW